MGYILSQAQGALRMPPFHIRSSNRHLQEGSFNGTERFRQAVDAEQQGLIDGRDADFAEIADDYAYFLCNGKYCPVNKCRRLHGSMPTTIFLPYTSCAIIKINKLHYREVCFFEVTQTDHN